MHRNADETKNTKLFKRKHTKNDRKRDTKRKRVKRKAAGALQGSVWDEQLPRGTALNAITRRFSPNTKQREPASRVGNTIADHCDRGNPPRNFRKRRSCAKWARASSRAHLFARGAPSRRRHEATVWETHQQFHNQNHLGRKLGPAFRSRGDEN